MLRSLSSKTGILFWHLVISLKMYDPCLIKTFPFSLYVLFHFAYIFPQQLFSVFKQVKVRSLSRAKDYLSGVIMDSLWIHYIEDALIFNGTLMLMLQDALGI